MDLGELGVDDVAVEVVHGAVGQNDEITGATVDHLRTQPSAAGGSALFGGDLSCAHPGRYGLTVRVVPTHADLATPVEMGLVAWAQESTD